MANLAGKTKLRNPIVDQQPTLAVDEWSTRVAQQFPGEIVAPRNTLRGHPQPWRTRPAQALNDNGPLHYSVKPQAGLDYSLCRGGIATGARQAGAGGAGDRDIPSSSTGELSVGDWEGRLGDMKTSCGLRGSIAPNWKPKKQEDMTATGSVNLANWPPGTTTFTRPGTVTLADVMKGIDDKPTDPTWSTATLKRSEWEDRLDAQGVGAPM